MRIGHGVSPHDAIVTHGDNEEDGRKQLGERERESRGPGSKFARKGCKKLEERRGGREKRTHASDTTTPDRSLERDTHRDTRGAQK